MKQDQFAFTLIELLVVIVVIAVLAGLALPVYSHVQESGRIVKCTGNLKQIAAGLLAFAGEHNGLCPLSGGVIPYQQGADPTTAGLGWTQQLEPYMGGTDRRVYICPSSSKILSENVQYSYFQGCHAAYVANNSSPAALRLSLLTAPSKYILAGDITSNTVFPEGPDADKDDFTQSPAFAATPVPFHNGKSNVVFADGHCGAFTAFDAQFMTTHYGLKSDGTGYNYSE